MLNVSIDQFVTTTCLRSRNCERVSQSPVVLTFSVSLITDFADVAMPAYNQATKLVVPIRIHPDGGRNFFNYGTVPNLLYSTVVTVRSIDANTHCTVGTRMS